MTLGILFGIAFYLAVYLASGWIGVLTVAVLSIMSVIGIALYEARKEG